MKLNIVKKDIKDAVVENSLKISDLNENVKKLAVSIESMAKVLAKQKEEIAEVKKETLQIAMKNNNEIRNIVLNIQNEFKNFESEAANNNSNNNNYDIIDFEFLAQEVAKRLNVQQNRKKVANIEKNEKKSFFDIKFILTMLFLIIISIFIFFGDYLIKNIKSSFNAQNDKINIEKQINNKWEYVEN